MNHDLRTQYRRRGIDYAPLPGGWRIHERGNPQQTIGNVITTDQLETYLSGFVAGRLMAMEEQRREDESNVYVTIRPEDLNESESDK